MTLFARKSSSSRAHARTAAAGAAALAAALLLTSCSGSGESGGGSGGLNVVATTTQLADFAAEVGGDDITLTGLLPAGGSAHHFDPSPADLLALGQADVLVANGVGLETFIDSAIEASGFDGEIIFASDGLDEDVLREITSEANESGRDHDHEGEGHDHEGEGHDHEDEHADEATEPEAGADDHDHAETADDHDHADDHAEEEHDHDHGDVNPHIWTSVRNASGMVRQIAEGFAAADPANESEYVARAEAYSAKLADLDTWITAQYGRVPAAERVLVSGHDSLRYYLHDYGIEFVGSILPSFEDNAEPSAAEIDELVHEIEEHGVKAVFVESSMSPKLAQTIADEAGIEVVDAEALYADSLGAPGADAADADGPGVDTYIGATAHNTRVILEAWGAEVDPLPATLDQ